MRLPHPVAHAPAALVLALSLCCVDIPTEARGKVVLAIFDPSKGAVPSPNDLALSEGRVAIAHNPHLSETENELKLSLNGRDGFSLGSAAKVQFTEGLSAATVSKDSFVVLDLGKQGEGAAPVPVDFALTYDDCDRSLSAASPVGLKAGHTYLYAVRGGEKADASEPEAFRIKGLNGEPVVPSPAFYFLKAGKDLREHPYAFPGTLEQKKASAQKLEAVRQQYEPLFQILEKHGLPRRDVAILWTVTAQSSGEAHFDPAQKKLPVPNDLLRNAATGRVSLPIDPKEPAVQQELKRGLNELDGFSTSGAITLTFTKPLKFEDFLANKRVRLFRADTLEEKKDLVVNVWPDGVRMSIEPLSPMLPNTQYTVVVTDLEDTGAATVTGMPLSQIFKLKLPLVVDGVSQVSSLCTDTAARLESLRLSTQPVLDALEAQGVHRDQVSAVWTFKTLDILSRLQALYETPYKQSLPLTVTVESDKAPWQLVMPLFNVERVISGKMTTWDYLDPITTAFRPNGEGVQRQIDFVMTIPEGYGQNDKIPVVVFGHGLLTERRLGYFLADKLAASGFAMMAIDFPLHGERSICSADADCEGGATCAADRTCRKGGQKADLARVTGIKFGDANLDFNIAGAVWGKGTPRATGAKYVDLEHMVSARDHLRQTLVDVSAQIRLLRRGDWDGAIGYSFDPDQIHYVGISLGGITGANLSATDPNLKRMLLNVGGAGIVELLEDSKSLGTMMRMGLQEKGITPERGDEKYEAFRNAGHWVTDEVDPANLIPYGNLRPRSYVDPESGETKTMAKKAIRMQMAFDPAVQDDEVVPNTATLRMLRLSGLDMAKDFRKFNPSTHGFLANFSEVSFGPGQQDMADFLEGKK